MTHSDMYRLDNSTFNFYEPLLLQDLWETYKNLGLPLSAITFLVNSHADNHFYNYICFTYYTLFMKYKFRLFIFKFKCETLLFFSSKNHGLYKRLLRPLNLWWKIWFSLTWKCFSVQYVKIIELHILHTWRHMQIEYM